MLTGPSIHVMIIALGGVLVASSALARPDDSALTLGWDAPASCPTREAAIAEVQELLGAIPPSDRHVDVRVTLRAAPGGRWIAELETQTRQGAGRRRIEGASCESVTQASALAIALTIDPNALSRQPALPAATPPVTRGPIVQASPVLRDEAAPVTPRGPTFDAMAMGAVDSSWPRPALGIEATGAVSVGRGRFELGGIFWLPRTLVGPARSEGARMTAAAGMLRGCYAAFWRVDGCAAGELGAVVGSGFGITHPRTGAEPWAAGTLGIWLHPRGASLDWTLGVDVGWAFVRPSVVIDGRGTVATPAPVFLRVALGLDWSLGPL